MSRRLARELVLHLIFEADFNGRSIGELIEDRLSGESLVDYTQESDVYKKAPSENQHEYIRQAAEGVFERRAELDEIITKYSVKWNIDRISRITKCVLRLCLYEIKYMGIPVGASANEALELIKKYDSEEAAAFANGIIGSFVKNEIKPGESV